MKQRLNVFIMLVFLVGQLILLPLQSMTAYAQVPALNDENVLTVSEEQPTTEEQASTDTTSGEGEQASTTESVIVEQPEEQTTEAEAENNKPADADGQTTSGLSPPVEDSDNEGLPEGSPEQGNETEGSSAESGEITTEENDGEEEQDPESEEAAKEGDENITFKLELDKLLLDNGSPIPEAGLDPRKNFQVHYNWSLDEGHAYKSGDQVTFQLPKQLQVFQEIPGTLEGEYATFVLSTDGKVTFTFTEAVENSSKINGTFWFMSKFDLSNTVIEDGNVILDRFEDGGTLQVPINTGDMAAEVHKTGQSNKNFAPTEINWTVTVDPKSIMHKNGVVTDTLPEGLTLQEGSVKVNGEAASVQTNGQQFTVSLGDFSNPQTITYTTTINEDAYDKTSFTNKATYKADGVTEVTKDATVHVKRGVPLTKEPGKYNPSDRTMEWTVNLNFNSKSMPEQTLTDSWGEASGVELIGGVELYEVTLNDNGKVQSTEKKKDLIATSQENGFTVQIPAINTPHQIKYKTKLSDRVETINNTVSWGSGEPQGNTGQATVETPTKGVDWNRVDYKEKKVGWVITHNSIGAPIGNVTITDTLNDGLTYVKDSVKVTVGGQDVKDAEIEVTDQALTVQLKGKVDGEIKVTFDTHFDYSKVEKGQPFKNKANVTWTDEFGKQQNKDSNDAEFWPNDGTKNNGMKSGEYDSDSKEITWEVIVNYQQNHYKNLVVTDSPQGNQKIDSKSVKVEEVDIDKRGNVTNSTSLDSVTPEIEGNNLKVSIGETDKPIRITYKTTLKDATAIEQNYKNKAKATENNDLVADLEETVQVPGGGQYVSKTGEQNGAVVDWTVVVNPQQANMSNVVLTDTISDNQEFLKDSVKVYTTEPGQTAAKDEYDASEYGVTFSDDGQTLTVKFNKNIDRTYVVKYTTLHFAGHGESVSNAYKITGDNLNKDHESGSTANETIEQLAGGTSSGEVGYLKVKKVGSDKPGGLEGITFELIDPVSKRVLKEGKTDQEGLIDFGRLKYGKYELKEKNTPEGYIKPTENYEVEVNTKYNKEDESTVQLHTITNYKAVSYSLKKVDSETKDSLEGVTFQLVDEKGEVIREGETNNEGYLAFTNVPEGNYTFKEVQPLDGYQQLDEEVKAEAGTTVEVKNVKKPTDPESPEQCEDFTVTVKEDGKPVEKDTEYTFTSEDGKTTVTEKTDENGKIVIDREDLPEGKYTVTDKDGNQVGEIEVEYDECETELDIAKPKQCEDFTVVVKENGKPVEKDTEYTFTSEDGKTTVTEKTDENGTITIDREKLPEGKYTVTDKDGNKVGEIEVEYDECETELDIKMDKPGGGGGEDPKDPEEPTTPTDPESPEQCEDFTVVVKEDGKSVEKDTEYTFTSEDGKTKVTGTTDENGKIVIDREELPEGKYTVTDKDGNQVGEIEVEYDECETELDIAKPKQCEDFTVVVKENGKPVEKDTEYTFTSEDGKTTVTEKTDKDGKLVIDREKLPEGKYTVIDKDGNPVGEITVEYDECGTELDITKKPADDTVSVTLVKYDANDESKRLAGATFDLFTQAGEKVGTYTTDEHGTIVVTDLAQGEYYFVETKAPKGYKLTKEKQHVLFEDGNPTGQVKVANTEESSGGGGGGEDPKDPEEPTTPTDPETPEQCEDFTVVVKDNGKPVEKDTEYTFASEDGETKVTATTDENGKIVIDREKLPEGKYTVTDKDGNPVGEIGVEYEECETELDIKTDKPGGGGGGEDPKDPEEPTTPTDPETPEQCEDFTVTVKEDGKPVKKDTEYTFTSEDGKTTVTEKTDKDGKLVIDREKLPEGKYTVTDKDGNPVGEITVEYEECETELNIKTDGSTGTGKTKVTLTKVDHKDESRTLEGAEFELYKKVENGPDELIMNGSTKRFITDDNGKIVVTDLAEGDYYFVEKRAPKGYQLNRKAQDFTVVENEDSTLVVTNKKRPSGGGGGGGGSTDPETPGTDPTDPEETPGGGGTEEPTDPETPGGGGTEEPTDPETPGEGGTEEPADPETPGEGGTEEPADPETPGEGGTEEPTDSETPGEGGTGKPTKPGSNGTVGKPTPSGPATPGKPVEKEGNETDSKGSKLPQTGEEQFIALIGFGALFVAFGGWLFLRNRRKEEQK